MTMRRWVSLVLVCVVAIGLGVALYTLPELVRRAVIARVHSMTGRPVAIERVDVGLLRGRVTVHGFRLTERDGSTPFADFERLDLRLHLPALLVGHVRIREMVLDTSTVRVVRLGANEFNFSDLLGGAEGAERGRTDLTVDHFVLKNGVVTLEDRALAEARTWTSEQITIEAHNVSTRRDGGRAVGRSVTAGAPVAVTVQNLRLHPIHLQATIAVEGLDLTLAQVYLPPDTIVLDRGQVTTTVTVALDARGGLQADGTADFEDVVVLGPDGGDPLAHLPRLTTRVAGAALVEGAMRLDHLAAQGAVSVRDPTAKGPGRFQHADVRANAANLTWPATTAGQIDARATVKGRGQLVLTGAVRPPPDASQLRLRMSNLDLAPWAQFLPVDGRVSGVAEADLRMNEPLAAGIPARLQGSIAVNRLAVADARRELLTARRVEATGLELHPPARARVGRLEIRTPRGIVERTPAGDFPLLAVLRRPVATPESSPPPARTGGEASPPTALTADVGEIVIRDGAVAWRDGAVSPAASLDVSRIGGRVTGVGWPLNGPLQVRLAFRPPGGGEVQISGRVDLEPIGADVRVVAKNAELAPYQPYLPTTATVSGAADTDLALTVPSLADRRATARGRVGVSRVDVRDHERTLVRVERALATGVDVEWPERVAVDRLALAQPWLVLERDEAGELSLLTVLPKSETSTSARSPAAAENAAADTAALAVTVAHLSVERGGVRIVDRAVAPAFAVDLQPATARARGLSTQPGERATFEVEGQLGPGAALVLRGTTGPLAGPLHLDLQGEVREFAVPRANPYVLQQAGWRTTEGRLTSAVQGRVDGDALSAKTQLRISRLELVRATAEDGAEARIGLPLGLLTSLMKDRHGDIHISFGVGGRLSDPQFDFSEAIWSAVRTVAVNAIALPVSGIGRVRVSPDSRIEGIDVDPIPFEPGTAEPTAEGHTRLARLAAFLDQLPAVRMAVTPVISSVDVAELERQERAAVTARPSSPDDTPAASPGEETKVSAHIRDLAKRRLDVVRETITRAGLDLRRLEEKRPAEEPDADSHVVLDVLDPEVDRPSKLREGIDRVRDRLTGGDGKQ